jgi:tight adherence protein C
VLDLIVDKVNDPQFLLTFFVALAVVATVLTVAAPLLETDVLSSRMKAVSVERDRIRAREREKLTKQGRASLRQEPKAYMKDIVDRFSLSRWLGTEQSKVQLAQAGYRGGEAEIAFLFFRLVMPILSLFASSFYLFVVSTYELPTMFKIGIVVLAVYIGVKLPELFLNNTIQKRQLSMRRAFPDALDLLLICVESGMSIEHAFRKVSEEIGSGSVPLAEELTLTMAELSFLPDRRTAYENFALRTGLDAARQIATVLSQAERYGTPLGNALRVVSDESRANRMLEAEKKAASLPPKLTVPMIIFFLPVLFAVILTPAIIQITAVTK